jgi:hypothetical protein
MRSLHAGLTRWLWGRAVILAVAILVGWMAGNFYAGLTVAVILILGLFFGMSLLSGWLEWRLGRRFAAPRGRVMTTDQVMEQDRPILLVTHGDDESGGWRFVNGRGDIDESSHGISVHIQQMIERDPSLSAIADLPLGWRAWRSSEDASWNRAPNEASDGAYSCCSGARCAVAV